MPGCKFVFDYDVATFLRAQVGGYRDVMLCVVYKDESGLSIIGEIQARDMYCNIIRRAWKMSLCRMEDAALSNMIRLRMEDVALGHEMVHIRGLALD